MAGDGITADGISASAYHAATKHHFHRYARSLGYLDWATQPDPFRRYDGAPVIELPRPVPSLPGVAYDDLFAGNAPALPFTIDAIGSFLRYGMGLSAWKQYGASRWALRVNPSSGNLHPTEAYLAWDDGIFHYGPRDHLLEQRCGFEADRPLADQALFVGLTSIHWREAWKYGERAFRYCQHDTGHAIAALRFAAALHGWQLQLLPEWSYEDLAAWFGTGREQDFDGAEREEPECLALVTRQDVAAPRPDPALLADCARRGRWYGRANRLSAAHVDWPLIDAAAEATRQHGRHRAAGDSTRTLRPAADPDRRVPLASGGRQAPATEILLRRRSALGYDPRGVLRRETFLHMLDRLIPGAPPWDAIDWSPQLHLVLFVHRVQDLLPGLYAHVRDVSHLPALKAAMRPEFVWEPVQEGHGLFLLAPIDVRATANRLSCNQDIAEDGFFSLGMLARFEPALRDAGESFYRRLFWEAGIIGHVLYLEAEAAGARGTGIGCYFDDPVHDLLGLAGGEWQSLYHFSMGLPVEDTRLTTDPGYPWESTAGLGSVGTVTTNP